MNKLLTKIAGLTLGLTMAIGVGVAAISNNNDTLGVSAADGVTTGSITITYGGFSGNPAYSSGAEYTGSFKDEFSNSVTVACKYVMKNNDNMQFQANNGNLYNKTALPGKLVSISLVQTGTARAFTAYGGDAQLFSSNENGTGKTPSGTSLGNVSAVATMTWEAGATTDYRYFAIHKGANAGYVEQIVITYEVPNDPEQPGTGGNENESEGASIFTLVKDVNDLAVGKEIVIAASGYNYALSTTQNENNRGHASIVKSGNNITFGEDVQILELKAGTKTNTYALYTGEGYLYAASSSKNYLRTQATNNDNGSWTVSVTNAGIATIKAQGTNTRNLLQYNNSSSIFSAYSSAQQSVAIYVKEVTSSVNITDIVINDDDLVLSEGAEHQLSFTVTPENQTEGLVFESSNLEVVTVDGGGLITAVANGNATITVSSTSRSVTKTIKVEVTAAVETQISVGSTNKDFVIGKPIAYHFTETQNVISVNYGDKVRTEKIQITDSRLQVLVEDEVVDPETYLVTENLTQFQLSYLDIGNEPITVNFNGIKPFSGIRILDEVKHFANDASFLVVDDNASYLEIQYESHWGEIDLVEETAVGTSDEINILYAEATTSNYEEVTHKGSIEISLLAIGSGSSTVNLLISKQNIEFEYTSELIIIRPDDGLGEGNTPDQYVKVTSTEDITNGKYLIVYETGSVAMNASLSKLDAVSNTLPVDINNGVIPATESIEDAAVNIDINAKTIKSVVGGYYIGCNSNSNTISNSTSTKYTNTMTIDASDNFVCQGQHLTARYLKFNKNADQARFRYYASGQESVQLYKFVEGQTALNNDFDIALNFIETYMHTEVKTNDSGTGQCASANWYSDARDAWNELDASVQELIINNFHDMFLRLQAWAIANGETIEYDPNAQTYVIKNTNNSLMTINNSFDSTLLILFACISFVSVTAIVIVRKRKEQ